MPVHEQLSETPKLASVTNLKGNLTSADIWLCLHNNEESWSSLETDIDRFEFKDMRNGSDLNLMGLLSSFPKERWIALCDGAGWSPITISALSWCQGAELDDVFLHWTSLPADQALPAPGNIAERAASFIKPELLPPNRMSDFLNTSNHLVAVAVMIAARKEPPEMDIPEDMASRLKAELKALVKPREERVLAEQAAKERGEIKAKAQRESERRTLLQNAADLIPGRMEERRWSRQQVREAVQSGDKGAVPGHPCGEARRYTDPKTGRVLLTDRETGNLLHVGRENYIYLFPFEADVSERIEWPNFRVDDLLSIYVPLINEWASVWRPMKAQYIHNNVFYILPSQPRPHDERWEFGPDTFVRCEPCRFYDGIFIAAVKRAERIRWG